MIVTNVIIPEYQFEKFYKFLCDETLTCKFCSEPYPINPWQYSLQIKYDSVDARKISKFIDELKFEHENQLTLKKKSGFWKNLFQKLFD